VLSQRQIDHFRTFGFLALPGFLGAERTKALRDEVDAALHDAYAARYDERALDGISGHYLAMASRLTPLSAGLVCEPEGLTVRSGRRRRSTSGMPHLGEEASARAREEGALLGARGSRCGGPRPYGPCPYLRILGPRGGNGGATLAGGRPGCTKGHAEDRPPPPKILHLLRVKVSVPRYFTAKSGIPLGDLKGIHDAAKALTSPRPPFAGTKSFHDAYFKA
jgi:hypothetical protein